MGDGIRYEEFDHFPPGFSAENIPDEMELMPSAEKIRNFDSCYTQ